MPTLPLSAITINRHERQRRELTGIDELALSIQTVGLINPIVVTHDNVLIAGERRYTALVQLGWTETPVTIFENLSTAEQRLIELEENVKREELSWRDHTAAVAEYHRIRAEDNPDWSLSSSAEALGMSKQHIGARMRVQEALEAGDPLVCKADKYSVARGIVERKRQRQSSADSAAIDDTLDEFIPSGMVGSAAGDEGAGIEHGQEQTPAEVLPAPQFHHTEFADFADSYRGPKFNFLHCDFPYGVGADKHAQGASDKFGGYADSADVYWGLCRELIEFIREHAEVSFHMMFWYSMDYHADTVKLFEAAGYTVNPFPLVWHKTDNSGILPDPKRGPRRIYETALLITGGDRFVVQAVANTIGHANEKSIHMSEKPEGVLRHFFRMFVDETTRMIDPTMGSGNATALAFEMGAKLAVGLERDEEFFLAACEKHLE